MDWKFTTSTLRHSLRCGFIGRCIWVGDDECLGDPISLGRLAIDVSQTEFRVLKEFVILMEDESKRLVEKFGIPH